MGKSKPKNVTYNLLSKYFKKNFKATYSDFCRESRSSGSDFHGIELSNAAYYSHRRRWMRENGKGHLIKSNIFDTPSHPKDIDLRGFKITSKNKDRVMALAKLLQKNSKATLKNAREAGIKVNSSTFQYFRRRYILGENFQQIKSVSSNNNGKTQIRKKGIYMTVFTAPSNRATEASKGLLKDFINVLNTTRKTKMQLVEYSDPKEIEVREIQ